MRFDASLGPDDPAPIVGRRVVIPGARLLTEWDTTTGRGNSVVPRRIAPGGPDRLGVVLDIRRQRLGLSDEVRSTVILADVAPRLTSTPVLLSVIGPVLLCPFVELSAFVDWLADTAVRDDHIPHVCEAATPWLTGLYPQHTDAVRHVPTFDTEPEFIAWAMGVGAVIGEHRLVPVPPGGKIDPTPVIAEADAIKEARRRLHNE